MILVLLGTFPADFSRPLIAIEALIHKKIITEEVIIQNGYTPWLGEGVTLRPFLSLDELDELYQRARIVISHAGTGSLVKGLKLKKKVIAIPRLAKYGEVVDNHQLEIVNEFANKGYLLPWHENTSLESLLAITNTFEPVPYSSDKQKIINYLTNYISSL